MLGEEEGSEEGSARDSDDGVGGGLHEGMILLGGTTAAMGKGRRYEGRGRDDGGNWSCFVVTVGVERGGEGR